jgi:hypothetical protein
MGSLVMSMLKIRVQVAKDAELREHDRAGRIAVESLDLSVRKFENIATRRVHALAGRRDYSDGKFEGPEVRALESELHDDNVTGLVELVQLSVHVGESSAIDLDGFAQFIRANVRNLN